MEKVTWELVNGTRALHNLLSMLSAVAGGRGLEAKPSWEVTDPSLGYYLGGGRYWAGVMFTEPQVPWLTTWKVAVDKGRAEAEGLDGRLFPSEWPKETLGAWRYGHSVDLDSEEAHFFSRPKEGQLRFLEDAVLTFLDAVRRAAGVTLPAGQQRTAA
jgi:hypothetical protein